MPPKRKTTPSKAAKRATNSSRRLSVKKVPAKKAAAKVAKAVARGMTHKQKCEMLRDYAKANGWWVEMKTEPFLCLTAKKDDGRYKDTIYCEWQEGEAKGLLWYFGEDGRNIKFRNIGAVKHHMDGSATIKRPSGKRKAVAKRKTRVDFEGQVILRKGDEDYKPIGSDIVDHFDHLKAMAPRPSSKYPAGGGKRFCAQRTMLFRPRAIKMKEELEAEGYIVRLEEHTPNLPAGCLVCLAPKERAAKTAPSRRSVKKASAQPARKRKGARA